MTEDYGNSDVEDAPEIAQLIWETLTRERMRQLKIEN